MGSSSPTLAETLKKTPLHGKQAALQAKFGIFGGWDLPIYYSSILEEHWTVRRKVGLFDVSHLGHLEISGRELISGLQGLVTQDLNRLEAGRAVYTPMLNPQGGILDEMILYRLPLEEAAPGASAHRLPQEEAMPGASAHRLEPARIRLVVNAANGDKVLAWLKSCLGPGAAVDDLRERVGTLAVQGPKAVGLVARLAQASLEQAPRYSVRAGQIAGCPVLMGRTGYTGEDGFELFVGTEDLGAVWDYLLEEGRPDGIQPIGLGARDTLRLEAGLPLGGSDLDETTTPLEAGLEWTISWDKGPFVGREALERQKREGVRRRLCGFRMKEAGIPRHGYPLFWQGRSAGQVTSGTLIKRALFDGSVKKCLTPFDLCQAIGLGYLPPEAGRPGTGIEVEIHGRRAAAEVVKLPFYRRNHG